MPADVRPKIEGEVAKLEEAMKADDVDKIKAAMEALQKEVRALRCLVGSSLGTAGVCCMFDFGSRCVCSQSMAMGQAMYQGQGANAGQAAQGEQGAQGAPGGKKGGDDTVVDAEFDDSK